MAKKKPNGNNKNNNNMELLEQHEFTYKGKDIVITISGPTDPLILPVEPYLFKASFVEKGLQEELIFKYMPADFIAVACVCEYMVQRVNKGNNDKIESTRLATFHVTPLEFYQFFMSATGATPMGLFLGRNFINGMTYEEKDTLGVRFFGSTLEPRQPVTFETEIEAADEGNNGEISVSPIDGISPFTYSINGGEPQATGVFNNLSPGEYLVRVEDSEGTYLEEVVTV